MAIVFGDEVASGKHAKDGVTPAGLENEADMEEFEEGVGNDIDSAGHARMSGDQAPKHVHFPRIKGERKKAKPST